MTDDAETEHTQYLAVCIDAVAREVTQRRMSWADAQRFVGGWLELVRLRDSMLFVDEEGLLKPELTQGFLIAGCAQALAGNGVIFGRSANVPGEMADCSLSLEAVRAMVMWLDR